MSIFSEDLGRACKWPSRTISPGGFRRRARGGGRRLGSLFGQGRKLGRGGAAVAASRLALAGPANLKFGANESLFETKGFILGETRIFK